MTAKDLPHIPYINALDGVRALSILLVILTHTAPLGPSAWQLNSTAGPMGMSLFFCLSGYLIISIIHRDPDPVSFLIRRVLRIVPAVALYLVVVALVVDMNWLTVVEVMGFVTNYIYEGRSQLDAPLSHLWSLSVEMHFYIAIGLLAFLFGRRSIWFVPPAALVITYLRIRDGIEISIETHYRVDEILAGGLLAMVHIAYADQIRAVLKNRVLAAVLIGLAALVWAISCHPQSGAMNYARPYLAATLVGIVMHSHLPVLHPILEGRIAAYIARISYALYIYHPLMIFGWMNTGSDWLRYLVKRPISYLLTLIAAHLSTYVWEARFQTLARHLVTRRREKLALKAAAQR